MPAAAEVELEPAWEPATTAAEALLEELRELRAGPAWERLPALLRHRVVRVLAVVEACAELCGSGCVRRDERWKMGETHRGC